MATAPDLAAAAQAAAEEAATSTSGPTDYDNQIKQLIADTNAKIMQDREKFESMLTASLPGAMGDVTLGKEGFDEDLAKLLDGLQGQTIAQLAVIGAQCVRSLQRTSVMVQAIGAHLVRKQVDTPATMRAAGLSSEADDDAGT